VIFAIFTKVCRDFYHFLPWLSTVPIGISGGRMRRRRRRRRQQQQGEKKAAEEKGMSDNTKQFKKGRLQYIGSLVVR